jgi:hypothetical protein
MLSALNSTDHGTVWCRDGQGGGGPLADLLLSFQLNPEAHNLTLAALGVDQASVRSEGAILSIEGMEGKGLGL